MGLTDGERIEMVVAGYNMVNDNSSWCPCVNTQKREVLSRDAALNEMFRPKDYPYLGYVAGKLYRTDLLKNGNKRFDESLFYNEDRLFCVSYLCAVRNEVAYMTRPVFNYYQRKGSLMGALSNGYNPKYVTDFYSYLKMLDEVKRIKTKLPVRQMVKTGMCLSYKTIIGMMINGKQYDKQAHHGMLRKLISTAKDLLFFVYPKSFIK